MLYLRGAVFRLLRLFRRILFRIDKRAVRRRRSADGFFEFFYRSCPMADFPCGNHIVYGRGGVLYGKRNFLLKIVAQTECGHGRFRPLYLRVRRRYNFRLDCGICLRHLDCPRVCPKRNGGMRFARHFTLCCHRIRFDMQPPVRQNNKFPFRLKSFPKYSAPRGFFRGAFFTAISINLSNE